MKELSSLVTKATEGLKDVVVDIVCLLDLLRFLVTIIMSSDPKHLNVSRKYKYYSNPARGFIFRDNLYVTTVTIATTTTTTTTW